MSNASVRLENLSRRYGKVQALDDLSLELPDGKFVTLLGPSGCGKTTTLSLIAGLEQPDEGTIWLGDREITRVPPNERGMAIVFQNYALYPNMSVFGNMAFSLKLQRWPKADIRRRVHDIAEMLSIEHLLDRKPGQLSGGQQQRVAIGRALVKEPEVFLLDEPFSNLDAALRSRMRTEIKRLHLNLGTTSVFVTHDQEEAMTLSDLIAVMADGKLVQFGTQQDVYSRPRNTYVATFLGKPRMSLLEGALDRHADGVSFVAPDLRLDLGTESELGLREGDWDQVVVGIRAEDVSLVADTGASGLTFKGQVQLLEPVGSDTFVEIAVTGSSVVARVPPDLPVAVGDNVIANVRAGRIHVFDAASTEADQPLTSSSEPMSPGSQRATVLLFDPIIELDWSYDIEREILTARGVELVIPPTRAAAEAALGEADVVVVSEYLPTELIAQLTRCVGFLSYKVGLDTVDGDALAAAGIPISSVAGYCTDEVADHGLTLLLAAQRRLIPFSRLATEGDWDVYDRAEFRSIRRIRGQTLGIIGAGRIGSSVAHKAQAFGMTTIAYDPYLTQSRVDGVRLVSLDELLANSDAIVLCSALTDSSARILDRSAFSRMKQGVIVVNVARGRLIDEDALLAELRNGRVAVAALDVRASEPPDAAADPLRALPNVILTQHLAATSVESHHDLHTLAAAEVLAMLEKAGRV